MKNPPEARHAFLGPSSYRWFLLAIGVTLFALLMIGGVILGTGGNWALRLCSLIGALSGAVLASLVAVDIYRPQAITPARMKVVVRVLLALPIIAIMLAVAGFLV